MTPLYLYKPYGGKPRIERIRMRHEARNDKGPSVAALEPRRIGLP